MTDYTSDILYEEIDIPDTNRNYFTSVQKYKGYVANEIDIRINEQSGLAGISRMYLSQVMFEHEQRARHAQKFFYLKKVHKRITDKVGFGGYKTLQEIKDDKTIILEHIVYLIEYLEKHYKDINEIYIPSTGKTSHEIFDLLVENGIIKEKKHEQIGVSLQLL